MHKPPGGRRAAPPASRPIVAVLLGLSVLLAAVTTGAARSAETKPPHVVSTGAETALTKHLTPERPTVFVFLKPSSTLEAAFLAERVREAAGRVGFALVHLKTGEEPVARQYEVKQTPTAIVYDRRGRLVARSADANEIRAAIRKAAGVPRIDWAEPGDPRFEEARKILGGPPQIPGIMRTMTLQPSYMASLMELSGKAHFSDGFLPRRTKELVATYVSALNKCRY